MSRRAKRRRKDILAYIEREGRVQVDKLVQTFGVSKETIRRDLRILDAIGDARKTYGGALKTEKTASLLPYDERLTTNSELKDAIGREAAKLLKSGDSIFIDGKTTCLALARHIPKELNLNVVTNSIYIASLLLHSLDHARVHMLGGQLDKDGIGYGPRLMEELRRFSFDMAFFSAIAVNARGCYFPSSEPQQLAGTLNEISQNLILLADSSKLEKHALMFGLELSRFKHLITDEQAPPKFVEHARKSGCQVILSPNR